MKAIAIVLGVLFMVGLISIKASVAVAFLGTCTAICLWINAKVKVPSTNHRKTEYDDEVMLESFDGTYERYTIY
ncbi:MAG: hypothetical protein AB2669_17565 [Candidatus Thiodiazotropha endolucinida]|nr:hypothetical protein [Candidatus Thiodiazotropha taylori]MCW4250830.1 hypothetical protein [Candidatus Thiodiazotropha endolucinida]MCG7884214.1 hypothetical protein [Candidatus Thiodiazotropha taylori]MCG8040093.1 hypothetical protein [Candidatus Thiodiazotropha taylori]MCG8104548.1 hypothetical protein [Candidatus Thiodiazotropha taylori]